MKADVFLGVFAAMVAISLFQNPKGGEISFLQLLVLAAFGLFVYWVQKPSRSTTVDAIGEAGDSESPGERVLFRLGQFFNRLAK